MNPFETLNLAHSSTVDRVAEELRRALFEGELDPGTPLREVALADSLGVDAVFDIHAFVVEMCGRGFCHFVGRPEPR